MAMIYITPPRRGWASLIYTAVAQTRQEQDKNETRQEQEQEQEQGMIIEDRDIEGYFVF